MAIGDFDPYNDPERRSSLDSATEQEWADHYDTFKNTLKEMEPWSDKKFNYGNILIQKDTVNHPPHYTNRKMEAIDIIEMIIEIEPNNKVAYAMSNVLKYLLRFRSKGNTIEDVKKARWYLDRMIKHLEDEDQSKNR